MIDVVVRDAARAVDRGGWIFALRGDRRAQLAQPRLVFVEGGDVVAWNRAVLLRERDVLLLRDAAPIDRMVSAFANDRIASVRAGRSVLLRHWVLNVAGALDERSDSLDDAIDEWQRRAAALGLRNL